MDRVAPIDSSGRLARLFLPRSERCSALWIALGGAAVLWAATTVGGLVFAGVSGVPGGAEMPQWTFDTIVGMTVFAAVALLVAVLVRFARAPKALALYVVSSALILVVASLSVPGGQFAVHAGTALGAIGGAWVAATVSLARIRDDGFTGDSPDGHGLSATNPLGGWAFLGWEGTPLGGSGLIAIALAAVPIIPMIAERLHAFAFTYLPIGDGLGMGALFTRQPVIVVAWGVSVYVVTRVSDVRSSWLGVAREVAVVVAALSWFLGPGGEVVNESFVKLAASVLLVVAAALLGGYLAVRREPATLSADERDDSVAPEAPYDDSGEGDE